MKKRRFTPKRNTHTHTNKRTERDFSAAFLDNFGQNWIKLEKKNSKEKKRKKKREKKREEDLCDYFFSNSKRCFTTRNRERTVTTD